MIASSRSGGSPVQAAREQLAEGRTLLGIGMAHYCTREAQWHALNIGDRDEQAMIMQEIMLFAAEQLVAERAPGHTICHWRRLKVDLTPLLGLA